MPRTGGIFAHLSRECRGFEDWLAHQFRLFSAKTADSFNFAFSAGEPLEASGTRDSAAVPVPARAKVTA
jgi:hypothetical protein